LGKNIALSGFQELLYQIFHYEKKYPVEAVCRLMGIEQRRFYSYSEGITYFPPDLIPNLYNATFLFDMQTGRQPAGEMRIWTFLLENTGLEAVNTDRERNADTVEKELLEINSLTGQLSQKFLDINSDGKITDREHGEFSCLASAIIRKVEGARAKIRPTRGC